MLGSIPSLQPRAPISEAAHPPTDSAAIAVIRLHALLERAENSWIREELTLTEQRSLAILRNIIAHAGYRAMDDDRFWITCRRDLPGAVDRLIAYGRSRIVTFGLAITTC